MHFHLWSLDQSHDSCHSSPENGPLNPVALKMHSGMFPEHQVCSGFNAEAAMACIWESTSVYVLHKNTLRSPAWLAAFTHFFFSHSFLILSFSLSWVFGFEYILFWGGGGVSVVDEALQLQKLHLLLLHKEWRKEQKREQCQNWKQIWVKNKGMCCCSLSDTQK